MDKKILIVEDDLSSQILTRETLKSFGQIVTCGDGLTALSLIQKDHFDILILDIHLPDKNGIELCSQIRNFDQYKTSTIFIASADEEINSKITAFSVGADDYIVKPYSPLELKARIERAVKKQKEDELIVDPPSQIRINKMTYRVYLPDSGQYKEAYLTPHEFKILYTLMKSPDRIFSRDLLINSIWGQNVFINDRTIDTHISMLRKKLGSFSSYLKSVRGEGYRWDASPLALKSA